MSASSPSILSAVMSRVCGAVSFHLSLFCSNAQWPFGVSTSRRLASNVENENRSLSRKSAGSFWNWVRKVEFKVKMGASAELTAS